MKSKCGFDFEARLNYLRPNSPDQLGHSSIIAHFHM